MNSETKNWNDSSFGTVRSNNWLISFALGLSYSCIQAVSKGLCFLGVRGRGGHRDHRKLGSKTYQF